MSSKTVEAYLLPQANILFYLHCMFCVRLSGCNKLAGFDKRWLADLEENVTDNEVEREKNRQRGEGERGRTDVELAMIKRGH